MNGFGRGPRALTKRPWRSPRRVSRRWTAIAPAAVLMLAGCTASGPTAEESRTAFLAALDDTQAALGGAWDNRDDPTPRGCLLSLWAEGVQYPALRIGPDPRSVEASVRAVEELWADWGFRTERTTLGEAIEVQGHHAGALLVFRASEKAMTLQGQSDCRPD